MKKSEIFKILVDIDDDDEILIMLGKNDKNIHHFILKDFKIKKGEEEGIYIIIPK